MYNISVPILLQASKSFCGSTVGEARSNVHTRALTWLRSGVERAVQGELGSMGSGRLEEMDWRWVRAMENNFLLLLHELISSFALMRAMATDDGATPPDMRTQMCLADNRR